VECTLPWFHLLLLALFIPSDKPGLYFCSITSSVSTSSSCYFSSLSLMYCTPALSPHDIQSLTGTPSVQSEALHYLWIAQADATKFMQRTCSETSVTYTDSLGGRDLGPTGLSNCTCFWYFSCFSLLRFSCLVIEAVVFHCGLLQS
jgi:hypothetical protein